MAREFDWVAFLDRAGVEWIDKGKNVARGHVNIRCPFCGVADPSKHFGIRLRDGAWGCYRVPEHRGRGQEKLVQAILRCSWAEAKRILEEGVFPEAVSLEELEELLREPEPDTTALVPQLPEITFPKEVKRPRNNPRPRQTSYEGYLARREFDKPYSVMKLYDLRWADSGLWQSRLLMPIRIEGKLLGWTGRAITPKARLRYRTEPVGETLRKLIYNFDRASEGGKVLAVVEGPLDALKLDWYGRKLGLRSVALLGLSSSPFKIALIRRLLPYFKRTVLLLDPEALAESIDLQRAMQVLGVEREELPEGAEDPGDLSGSEVRELVGILLDEAA